MLWTYTEHCTPYDGIWYHHLGPVHNTLLVKNLLRMKVQRTSYQINLIMIYMIHHTATSYYNSPVTLNLPSCNTVDIRVIWLQWMKSNANEYWHPGFILGLQYWGELSNFEGENLYWYIFITYCWVIYFWGYKISRIVQNLL